MAIWRRMGVAGMSLVMLLCGGCLIGSSSRSTRSGNYVPEATFSRIDPGKTTAAWVRATLGEPSDVTRIDDGTEVWKWTYTEHKSSSGHVFLIFGGSSVRTEDRTAFVELKNGLVTRKWRT